MRGVGDEVQREGPATATGVVGVDGRAVFLDERLGDFAKLQ